MSRTINYKTKYEKALERAKSYWESPRTCFDIDALKEIFPEFQMSEDENAMKELLAWLKNKQANPSIGFSPIKMEQWITWLEKQWQNSTQEIEPFEAEHGKYYYCIKDYFCGGRKQASKGDVIQALRGLPIMGLKDASEYFLPVNSIKCKSAWSEEDEWEVCVPNHKSDGYIEVSADNPVDACVEMILKLKEKNLL